jgi:polyhydroxybutyrate depolymerase
LTVQVSGEFPSRYVAVGGQGIRQYSIYVPPFSDNNPHPAIIALHGGGATAMIQASTTLLNKFAHEQEVYVVYLEGTGLIQTFNAGSCCGCAQQNNVDDVQYVETVPDNIEAKYNVDPAKIFATGFSNGAMMSHRLACTAADRFAAIAAVSGGSGLFDKDNNQYYTCSPSRPIPILLIQATNDRNYPFGESFQSMDRSGIVRKGFESTSGLLIQGFEKGLGGLPKTCLKQSLSSLVRTGRVYGRPDHGPRRNTGTPPAA